ncbi:unnamed protein product [Cladocopium goreaui]|uniref:Thiol-disulfide oxidoreductase ResA n=1 Tax=Cladocopium goreaui TaxID=2562237 RepID=A0A9P1BEU4_9DINO|nr:unnamed protein product [Cladocopium goreaui]
MLRQTGLRLVAALAVVALVTSVSQAGRYNKVLSIGDNAPTFTDIIGTDGEKHSLSDFDEAKLVVAVFTCNSCPVAVACEDRMIELQKKYGDQGVQLVAINVNNVEGDKLEKMKERAEQKGFNFPYLYDESQKSAKAFGAAVTPHFFLLDQDRKVVYMGAMDDSPLSAGEVQETYLEDAITAALSGKKPETTETRQQGCGIKYE